MAIYILESSQSTSVIIIDQIMLDDLTDDHVIYCSMLYYPPEGRSNLLFTNIFEPFDL